ncbi:MAG: hypothetical protein D3904_05845 [Candidatus Electrothrix sp. EH2]|nr:hypothetical protein [Candidatus Electrothrix sp. EH2]
MSAVFVEKNFLPVFQPRPCSAHKTQRPYVSRGWKPARVPGIPALNKLWPEVDKKRFATLGRTLGHTGRISRHIEKMRNKKHEPDCYNIIFMLLRLTCEQNSRDAGSL